MKPVKGGVFMYVCHIILFFRLKCKSNSRNVSKINCTHTCVCVCVYVRQVTDHILAFDMCRCMSLSRLRSINVFLYIYCMNGFWIKWDLKIILKVPITVVFMTSSCACVTVFYLNFISVWFWDQERKQKTHHRWTLDVKDVHL